MSDFDLGNDPRPEEPEVFRPGVTITPDGVSVFATDFRAQALREGVLVDVSEMAREVGFAYPMAVTAALWEDINAIPEAYVGEDVPGRLWDVLWMAKLAVQQSKIDGPELLYTLILHVEDRSEYTVRLVCEPGDDEMPVITLSNPEMDVDLALGEIVLTNGALDAFVAARVSPGPYLARHQRGNWGELDSEDIATNNRAAREGTRVLSQYTLLPTQVKIWVVTQWDRSVTTVLLPSEY